MVNQEIIKYAKSQLARGVDKESIKQLLLANNWSAQDIDDSFKALEEAPLPPSAGINNMPASPANVSVSAQQTNELRSFGRIFKEAWSLVRSNLLKVIGLSLIPLIPGILLLSAVFLTKSLIALALLTLIFGVIYFILAILSGVAFIYLFKDNLSVFQSYKKSFFTCWSWGWISLLVLLVTLGGFFMGVVPGIIFSILFSFSIFAFVAEGDKGLNALLKSRAYVMGYWWPTAGRSVLFGLTMLLIYLPFALLMLVPAGIAFFTKDPTILTSAGFFSSLIKQAFQIFAAAMGVAFSLSLFKNFQELKPELVNRRVEGKKGFWIFAAIWGIVAIPVTGFVFAVILINPQERLQEARDSKRLSDLSSLQSAIFLYQADTGLPICTEAKAYSSANGKRAVDGTGWLPVDLTKIRGGSPLDSLHIDPSNNAKYYYSYACDPGNQTFELNATLESDKYLSAAANDGGNNSKVYESGTDPGLNLIN